MTSTNEHDAEGSISGTSRSTVTTVYFDCASSESALALVVPELADGRPGSAAAPTATADNVAAAAISSDDGPDLVRRRDEPPPPTGAMQAMLDATRNSTLNKPAASEKELVAAPDVTRLPSPVILAPPTPFDYTRFEKDDDLKEKQAPRRAANVPGVTRHGSPAMLAPPTPFNWTEPEKEDSLKLKKEQAQGRAPLSEDEARLNPPGDGASPSLNAADDSVDVEEGAPAADAENSDHVRRSAFADVVEDTPVARPASMDEAAVTPRRTLFAAVVPRRTLFVPIAFPVEDGLDREIVVASRAEPVLAWWRQKPAKRFFACVCVLFVAAAVAIGVSFSSHLSSPHEAVPTTSPPTCVMKLVPRTETIAMVPDDPYKPKVSVDGTNMVVEVQNRASSSSYTSFYSFMNGEWNVTNMFREISMDVVYNVKLSGGAAFVGFPYEGEAGSVSVYEQNESGEWKRIEEPFAYGADPPQARFGYSVTLDGKLACVGDREHFFLFRRDDERWTQFDRVDRGRRGYGTCSVARDIIAIQKYDVNSGKSVLQIYRYVEELGGVMPHQDPIGLQDEGSVCMSHDRLIYSDPSRGIFVHHREEGQAYTLRRQFLRNMINKGKLELGEYIFTAYSGRIARVFVEQNGDWSETMKFDHSYNDFRFSGRTLFATNETGVTAFDIEGCS